MAPQVLNTCRCKWPKNRFVAEAAVQELDKFVRLRLIRLRFVPLRFVPLVFGSQVALLRIFHGVGIQTKSTNSKGTKRNPCVRFRVQQRSCENPREQGIYYTGVI